ncbi:hypothetical protein [Actinomycetospora flava]|uniref:Integral membrane protein n=1 Tax=Actinomycetospora flava TaxID=3129232 RepID=A0ABU8M6D7_9PSEU
MPFALLNLARYAFLTWDDALVGPKEPDPERGLPGKIADGLLRVLGLVMTLSVVVTAIYVPAELVVNQCLADTECVARNTWLDFAESWTIGQATLVAAVPVVLVIVGIGMLGRRASTHHKGPRQPCWLPERKFGDRSFWTEVVEVRRLRSCHLAAALAVGGGLFGAMLLTSQSPVGLPAESYAQPLGLGLAIAGAVLAAVCALVVATIAADVSAAAARALPALCGVYAVGSLVATVVVLWGERGKNGGPRLTGLETVTNLAAIGTAVLLVLLLGLCGWLSGRFRRWERVRTAASRGASRPAAFAPMWFGFAPVVAVALGSGVLLGGTAGAAFQVADLLGTPAHTGGAMPADAIVLSTSYWTGAWLAGVVLLVVILLVPPIAAWVLQRVTAAFLLAAAAIVVIADVELGWAPGIETDVPALVIAGGLVAAGAAAWVWEPRARRATGLPAQGAEADDGVVADELVEERGRAVRRVARAQLSGQAKYRYHLPLGLVAAVLGAALIAGGVVAGVRSVVPDARAAPPAWLAALLGAGPAKSEADGPTVAVAAFGAWATAALIVAVVGLGYRAFRQPETRASVGVLWDLMSFWPRLVHPLCPPPYGGRAVLELADRAAWHLDKRNAAAVVLSGHSQGSLVCVAAATLLVRNPWPDGGRGDLAQERRAAQSVGRLGLLTYGSQLQWAFARLFPCSVGFHHQEQLYRALSGRWINLYRTTDPLGGPVLSWPGDDVTALWHPSVAEWGTHGHGGGAGTKDARLADPRSLTRVHDEVLPPLARHSRYTEDPSFTAYRDAVGGVSSAEPDRSLEHRPPAFVPEQVARERDPGPPATKVSADGDAPHRALGRWWRQVRAALTQALRL